MKKRSLRYTFQRAGVYYAQLLLTDGSLYRKSLLTDSYREASDLMIILTPHILQFKRKQITLEVFEAFIKALLTPSSIVTSSSTPLEVPSATIPKSKLIESKPVLKLAKAWNDFKYHKIAKGEIWNLQQAKKNECSGTLNLAI